MRATGTKANVQRILGRVAGATASTKSEVEEMPEDKRQALRLGLQRHEVGQVLRNVSRELAQREQQIADRRTICSQRSGPRPPWCWSPRWSHCRPPSRWVSVGPGPRR